MSPADVKAVNHIAVDIRHMSDADLDRLAAKNACLPGENAAAIRHEIDKEQEYRRVARRRMVDAMAPAGRWGCEK